MGGAGTGAGIGVIYGIVGGPIGVAIGAGIGASAGAAIGGATGVLSGGGFRGWGWHGNLEETSVLSGRRSVSTFQAKSRTMLITAGS